MHAYATDSDERRTISLIVAAVAALASWLTAFFLKYWRVTPSWWIDVPAVITYYSIFYVIHDRFLWKALSRRGIVRVPDLNGTWKGTLTSSHENHERDVELIVTITQTWRRMAISAETALSRSRSTMVALSTESAEEILLYEYVNEPRSGAGPTMHAHRGSATIRFRHEGGELFLDGDYYTGRDRMNHGTFSLQRKP